MTSKTLYLPLDLTRGAVYSDSELAGSEANLYLDNNSKSYNRLNLISVGQWYTTSPTVRRYVWISVGRLDLNYLPKGFNINSFVVKVPVIADNSGTDFTMNMYAWDLPLLPHGTDANWPSAAEITAAASQIIAQISTSGIVVGDNTLSNVMSLANLLTTVGADNYVDVLFVSSRYASSSVPSGNEYIHLGYLSSTAIAGNLQVAQIQLDVDINGCDFFYPSNGFYGFATSATWSSLLTSSSGSSAPATTQTLGSRYYSSVYENWQYTLLFDISTMEKRNIKNAYLRMPIADEQSGTTGLNYLAASDTLGFVLLLETDFNEFSPDSRRSASELQALTKLSECTNNDILSLSTEGGTAYLNFKLNAAGIDHLLSGSTIYYRIADLRYYNSDSAPLSGNDSQCEFVVVGHVQTADTAVKPILIIEYEDVASFHGSHF